MPSTSRCGSVRSAAVVNAEIRALWARSGGVLSPSEREAYHLLLVEWAAAVRGEQTGAEAA